MYNIVEQQKEWQKFSNELIPNKEHISSHSKHGGAHIFRKCVEKIYEHQYV